MIQWKLPREGAKMKAAGGGEVFMNPQRDIAHAFTDYLLKAFDITADESRPMMQWYYQNGGTDDDLLAAARYFRKFVETTEKDKNVKSLHEAATAAGYSELSLQVRLLLGHALLNVVSSAFFHGYREALSSPTEDEIELDFYAPKGGRVRNFLRSILRKLLYALS